MDMKLYRKGALILSGAIVLASSLLMGCGKSADVETKPSANTPPPGGKVDYDHHGAQSGQAK